jgi:pyruvate dehydrogenase E1 component alpha subunit
MIKNKSIAPEHLKRILISMIRIRCFEEMTADLAESHEFKTPIHLSIGQEAIAASVCENLTNRDFVFSTHRNHGHYIAQGGNLRRLLAEIFGKDTGCSLGHGGSMHVIDPEAGFMGSSAIVAGTIPISVGAGLSAKMNAKGQISVAFFGDGATDEGVFYESINMAALYNIPVVFICENNLFSTHLPMYKRQKTLDIYNKVASLGMESKRVDGNNPIEVFLSAGKMIESARTKRLPAFLECMTYRWRAHVGPEHDIDIGFRKKEEIDYWKAKCPILFLRQYMISGNIIDELTYNNMEQSAKDEVTEALSFARRSAFPDKSTLDKGMY